MAQEIGPFRADVNTAKHFHRNLRKVLENAQNGVANNGDGEDVKVWCRWAMKRIIRAGFVLVMDKEQSFTRDLYPAYELFSKHYPDQESNMKLALLFAVEPTDDVSRLSTFLSSFGNWMVNEVEHKFS